MAIALHFFWQIHQQVVDSVAQGARLVTGGIIPDGSGSFYPPTVLADVNESQVVVARHSKAHTPWHRSEPPIPHIARWCMADAV